MAILVRIISLYLCSYWLVDRALIPVFFPVKMDPSLEQNSPTVLLPFHSSLLVRYRFAPLSISSLSVLMDQSVEPVNGSVPALSHNGRLAQCITIPVVL